MIYNEKMVILQRNDGIQHGSLSSLAQIRAFTLSGCRLQSIAAPHCMYIYFDIYTDDIKLTFTLWANKTGSKCPF